MIDQALNAMQHGFPFSHAVLKYAMESYDLKMSRVLRFCQELSIIFGKGFKISVNPKYLLLACKEIEIRFAGLTVP